MSSGEDDDNDELRRDQVELLTDGKLCFLCDGDRTFQCYKLFVKFVYIYILSIVCNHSGV